MPHGTMAELTSVLREYFLFLPLPNRNLLLKSIHKVRIIHPQQGKIRDKNPSRPQVQRGLVQHQFMQRFRAQKLELVMQKEKKMEKYIEWKPLKDVPDDLYLDRLTDSPDGLVVVLVDGKGRRIEINFGVVPAYRNVMEEMRSSFWPSFHHKKRRKGSLWTAEDSAWLAEFSEADLIHHQDCKHYLIVTKDDCIDVITSHLPEVVARDGTEGAEL